MNPDDSTGLQNCIQVTIEYLDLIMENSPSKQVADASNLLEDLLKELKDEA